MIQSRMVLFFLVLLASLSAQASLRDLPLFRIPNCLGVNIHFAEPQEADLNAIREAGFELIRMDLGWEGIEREKGKYDFGPYQRLTAALRNRGIVPIYIIDYSNTLYEKNRSVVTEEGRKAFGAFAAEAVRNIGQGVLWEIWNEPNIEQFWPDQPSADAYVLMAKEAAAAMRAVDPECTILAPATSRIPMDFLKECFEKGLLDSIDVLSVHPYREKNPETAMEEYTQLRELIKQYGKDRDIPIVSGEWGYSVHPYKDNNVDEHKQAQYLARQFLVNMMSNIRVSIWYDWKNDGPDPAEREHNFGTVKQDLQPKEAYIAAKTLMSTLNSLAFQERLPSDPSDYLLVFGDGNKKILAAWTTGEPHHFTLPDAPYQSVATSMLGTGLELIKEENRLIFPVTQDPIYIPSAP